GGQERVGSTWPANRPPTRSWPPPGPWASTRPTPPCSRTPWPASRPDGRGSSAVWSASTGSGRPTTSAATAPTSSSPTWPSCPVHNRRLIEAGAFRTEPWSIREERLDVDLLAQSESVLALANGHLGLRGNLDEGEPYGLPGTYLNGVYELRPLPYAEAGFGYPESGQTMINLTNGKVIRLLVDDEPFDVRYGTLRHHERVLDLRAGTLRRTVEWASPAGQVIAVRSVRLVSFSQRAVAAIEYEVEAVDDQARVVVQSELVANEPMPAASSDPRVSAVLESPLVSEDHGTRGDTADLMVHRTDRSGLRLAAAMEHVVDGPDNCALSSECGQD